MYSEVDIEFLVVNPGNFFGLTIY